MDIVLQDFKRRLDEKRSIGVTERKPTAKILDLTEIVAFTKRMYTHFG